MPYDVPGTLCRGTPPRWSSPPPRPSPSSDHAAVIDTYNTDRFSYIHNKHNTYTIRTYKKIHLHRHTQYIYITCKEVE